METRFKLEEGWSTFFLLWAMILVSATAIMQTGIIDGLEIIPVIGSFALFAGLLLAKSRFSANTAHLFSLVFGLFALFYFTGTILPFDMPWRERVFDVVDRLLVWFGKAIDGGTSRDGLIFVIHTSAVYWLLGYTAAWYTFRRLRIWRAVVPTGVVLLSVVYYYIGPKPLPYYLALYILLALLFVARTHLIDEENKWRLASTRYERGIRITILRAAFLGALVALIVAWFLPGMSASAAVGNALSGARGPWHEFQDNWTRLFASLRSYGTGTSDPYQDSLVLGGPRTVGNTPIMDVYVPQRLPNVYWQAKVYETYNGEKWDLTDERQSIPHFPDDGLLDVPLTRSREVITQTVVNYLPNSGILYGAPEVVGSDRQMYIDTTQDEAGNMLISAIRSRYVLKPGAQYQIVSRISYADEESLRSTPAEYPEWIEARYLQLPDSVTPQTLRLAEELTVPYNNSFDKTIAVRNYLRENIEYNDQIQAPPEGVDAVHYTLFDIQEGYCNYYASAMAVMLRSQGIPARIVSGYAQGEFNEETNSYRVRASNAHTWTEVYFPGYGWIQFEPTAALPVEVRPETAAGGGDAFSAPAGPTREEIEEMLQQGMEDDFERASGLLDGVDAAQEASFMERFSVWQVLGAVVILAIAGVLVFMANEFNRRVEADITRSYTRLGSWARWLGVLFRPVHTPYERADLMTAAVPEGRSSIRTLTQQYVLKQFSKTQTADAGFDPSQEWQALRPILLRHGITIRLQRLIKKISRR